MSLRSQVKKEGEYPITKIPPRREAIKLANHTIILSIYETDYTINLYLGGVKHWCIHCELSKENNTLKKEGFLIKIRYDMLCSVEESIGRGGDITKLLKLLLQIIHDRYPDVKYLLFNDLSTRRCDNTLNVNLAVMTYLYTEKTWYEKNFGASISSQSKTPFAAAQQRLTESKRIPWDVVKSTIINYTTLPYSEDALELLYENSKTWKEFFGQIEKTVGIKQFCIFISSWLDSFTLKYFNSLMGMTYQMPIAQTDIIYTATEWKGGARYKSFFKGARKNRTIKRFSEVE